MANTSAVHTSSIVCSAFLCAAGACMEGPRCSGATPVCEADGGACLCTTTPADSCASATNNKACQPDGACGCTLDADCVAGQRCGGNNRCTACNITTACGSDCQRCDSLPQSGGDAIYFACTGNTAPAASACVTLGCDATRANCDGQDQNQCEVNLLTNANHCSACGVECASGTCSAGGCTCEPAACPLGQTCTANACSCQEDSQCAVDAGYACADAGCVRR